MNLMNPNDDRLECDILTDDGESICSQKAISLIWRNKENPEVLKDLLEILSIGLGEKRVLKDIEFYLPQIAHWAIHFSDNATSYKENNVRFIILICSHSMHIALQFSFLVKAYLEDYQPEDADGDGNPMSNPLLFHRCGVLLQGIIRSVIYGSKKQTPSRFLFNESLDDELSSKDSSDKRASPAGYLLFKRSTRKSELRSKGWKRRYFAVQNGILLCYREDTDVNCIRSMLLANCDVEVIENHPKYGNTCFDILNTSNNTRFHLQAESSDDRQIWIQRLHRNFTGVPPPVPRTGLVHESPTPHPHSSPSVQSFAMTDEDDDDGLSPINARNISEPIDESQLTREQKIRFHHFRQQNVFVTNLTNMCERLRFKDKSVRKYFLRRDLAVLAIPPMTYIPLCSSTDTVQLVRACVPAEAHAFSTKARCPSLVYFELEEHPLGRDLASFLGTDLEAFKESEVIARSINVVTGFSGTSEMAQDEDTVSLTSYSYSPPTASDREGSSLPAQGKETEQTAVLSDLSLFHSRRFMDAEDTTDSGEDISSSTRGEVWTEDNAVSIAVNKEFLRIRITQRASSPSSSSFAPASREVDRGLSSADMQTENADHVDDASSIAASTAVMPAASEGSDVGTLSEQGGGPSKVNKCIGESFADKAERIRGKSSYAELRGWRLGGMIAKSNDDLRQEVFVMQLIAYYQKAFKEANLPAWIFTYKILSTSQSTGLIELIPNASSIDGIKKSKAFPGTLRLYYEQTYGGANSAEFKIAMDAYVSSLAAYSIVSYLLGIKDRHNGNVMIDTAGHIIHIDFGFVFGFAPGKAFSMEKCPFKLTEEMVDVMGGLNSEHFKEFERQCVQNFIVARRHVEEVSLLLEVMTANSNYPAFQYNPNALADFTAKLCLSKQDSEMEMVVQGLIKHSYKYIGTGLYDDFQVATNGIAK
jgi:hypothetical protein